MVGGCITVYTQEKTLDTKFSLLKISTNLSASTQIDIFSFSFVGRILTVYLVSDTGTKFSK